MKFIQIQLSLVISTSWVELTQLLKWVYFYALDSKGPRLKYGTAPPKVWLKTKGLAPMNLVQGYGIEDIKAANLQQIVHVIQQLLFNQTNQEKWGFRVLDFSL